MRTDLIKRIEEKLNSNKENHNIPKEHRDKVEILFSDNSVLNMCRNVCKKEFLEKLNYEQLREISETLGLASTKLKEVVKKIDIHTFLKDGYRFDLEAIQKQFDDKGLKSLYPNIDLKFLADTYQTPFRQLPAIYDKNEKIYCNSVVVRKFIIAIFQMVLNEMDLVVCYTGSEGAGKSTLATQHTYLIYHLLTQAKIIDYKFDIKKMMFNSLSSFRLTEDEFFGKKYRILVLDEGNELHRQNWKEEEVQTFFQRLRRERFEQRIKLICIPVLGELMTNIIMSRVNFIFEVKTKNQAKVGLLEKGDCNFYIIPRGTSIYSYKHRKELTKDQIKGELYDLLKDKSYLKGLPQSLVIQNFRFNGVSGFKKSEYIEELKQTNNSFSVKEGKRFTTTQLFHLYRSGITLKKLGITSKDPRYATLSKMLQQIKKYFLDNPRLLQVEEEKFNLKYNNFAQTL